MPLLLLLAALSFAAPADGQCCGDCNTDGTVAINELITAVGRALDGCTAPTRTAAPTPDVAGCGFLTVDFGGAVCLLTGQFTQSNQRCSRIEQDGALTSDGELAVLAVLGLTDEVAFALEVTGPLSAQVVGVSFDNFDTIDPVGATLRLNQGGYDVRVGDIVPVPFTIDDCPFDFYRAQATGIIGSANRRVNLNSARAAIERMRRRTPAPRPNFTRH